MSLLNDMLRDLARQQPNELPGDNSDILIYPARAQQRTYFFWLSSALIFILVFLLVLAIKHFVIRVFDKNNAKPATELIINAQKKPLLTAREDNNSAADKAPLVVQKSVPPQDHSNAQLQLQIDDLLVQANHALAIDRLTSPIEDNAYSYYKKILDLDPNYTQAKQGLELIASHYMEKAKEQLQSGNRSQANDFIQRAMFVDPDYSLAQVAADHIDVSTTESQTDASQVQAVARVEPKATSRKDKSTALAEQKQIKTESVKSFDVAEAQSLSVTPNAASKDEQMAQLAQQLLAKEKIDEALSRLKNFVASETKPAQSAALLADIYLQQGNTQAAEAIFTHADYLSVVDKAKINARLLSQKGNDTDAIKVLEQQLPAAENNENYRALLASLYHKTGNYQLSMVNYQRLLNSFGDKPAYWLGLALAFDGLSQYKSALQAYKHLREFPQLQEQVKTYTDQRIAALRSE